MHFSYSWTALLSTNTAEQSQISPHVKYRYVLVIASALGKTINPLSAVWLSRIQQRCAHRQSSGPTPRPVSTEMGYRTPRLHRGIKCNRAGHYIILYFCPVSSSFFFLSFFFSSPNLSGRRLDVYNTSTDKTDSQTDRQTGDTTDR